MFLMLTTKNITVPEPIECSPIWHLFCCTWSLHYCFMTSFSHKFHRAYIFWKVQLQWLIISIWCHISFRYIFPISLIYLIIYWHLFYFDLIGCFVFCFWSFFLKIQIMISFLSLKLSLSNIFPLSLTPSDPVWVSVFLPD